MHRQILVTLLGASVLLPGAGAAAADREKGQPRPMTIRWTQVKKVNQLDQSFTVERKVGRDGEQARVVDVVVMVDAKTKLEVAPREGQAAPPPGTFKDVTPGTRVKIEAVPVAEGKVRAVHVLLSPKAAAEGEGRRPLNPEREAARKGPRDGEGEKKGPRDGEGAKKGRGEG